jgi:arylsulfatase A-like enzyme
VRLRNASIAGWHLALAIACTHAGCAPSPEVAPDSLQRVGEAEAPATIGSETRLASGTAGKVLHYGDFASADDVPEFLQLPDSLQVGNAKRVVLARRLWSRTEHGRSASPVLQSGVVAVDKSGARPRARLADLGKIVHPGPFSLQIVAFPLPDSAASEFRGEVVVPDGGVLDFGVAIRQETWGQGGGPVEFEVSLRDGGKAEQALFSTVIDPDGEAEPGWLDQRIDLAEFAGRRVTLRFGSRRTGGQTSFSLPVFSNPIVYSRQRRDPRPNIVLVSLDTLRARSVGAYGYARDTTPFFDALAERGTLFENAITASVTTSPAHMSLFTGLYPVRHGIREGLHRKAPHAVTLAQRFRGAGFRTAAFTENGYLVRRRGFGDGFGRYTENVGETLKAPGEAPRTFAQARHWLAANAAAPFFLFLHTYEVHSPYDPEAPYTQLFEGDGEPASGNAAMQDTRDRYDREIRIVDEELERLFTAIAEAGLADSTIVVVTSDHGEEFSEHGGYQHGGAVYEESVRVPLLFVGPGRIRAAQRHTTPVSLVDIAPTLLELAGVPVPENIDGASLATSLERGDAPAMRTILSEARATKRWLDPTRHVGWNPPLIAVRRGDSKFIVHRPASGPADPMLRFDLASDPAERQPLAIDAEAARAVDAAVDRYLGQSSAPEAKEADVSPMLKERLRALGYAE